MSEKTVEKEKPVILVVDDDEDFYQRVRALLGPKGEKAGSEIVQAPTFLGMQKAMHTHSKSNLVALITYRANHQVNAMLGYLHWGAGQRALPIIIREDNDPEAAIHLSSNGAYYIFDKDRLLDLSEVENASGDLVRVVNNSPVWDLLRKFTKDPMTGFDNLAGFLGNVSNTFEAMRDRRKAASGRGDRRSNNWKVCSILMIDANRFKRINDNYSYDDGNRAIKQIAEAIRKVLRPIDHPCRMGGDEFMALLPGATLGHAQNRGEELQRELKRMPLRVERNGVVEFVEIAVSFGAAEVQATELTDLPEMDFMRRKAVAEAELKRAKRMLYDGERR